ncbi:polysaccharide lyase family 8 super-sandwich domain-containing protein [Vibrio sp. NTOU-M3]|uniref:polysaccharide lyase family 8 super-sandwich domain-containing protein n=1 Tax=Vibrio sp. NTOU-M3 TaxID=3234954 RepID=UPI00349F50EF
MISQHLTQIQSAVVDEVSLQQITLIPRDQWHQNVQQWQREFSRSFGWRDIPLSEAEQDGQVIHCYLQRVLTLACEYHSSQSPLAAEYALQALDYWYEVNPQNWNWWWNQIGRQRLLGPIALMLAPILPDDLKAQMKADLPDEATMTGANKADLAHGMAFGALLTGNEATFEAAMNAICETIEVTEGEGIQADYSYQQHGPQLQNGGYGESFINVALPWAYVTSNTPFSFPLKLQRLLGEYYLRGTVWMTRNGYWDYNVCGRAIAKPDLEKPFGRQILCAQARMLRALFPQYSYFLESYIGHLNGETYPFAGFKHFWCSDYAVSANSKYAVTVKGNSQRTNPIETGNQENLLGFWLGFGSMNIGATGLEYRDIFPYWDWRRVPGVTNPQVAMPAHEWGRVEQQTHWTGGVSNGRWGIFTFELDVQETQGLKSWFFFDDMVIALGAGICSSHEEEIRTTINQCHFEQTLWRDGVSDAGAIKGDARDWVHHGKIGYVLHGGVAQLKCEERGSNWYRINHHLSEEPVSGEVFELTISHGIKPNNASYQYTILPGATASDTQAYANAPQANIIANQRDVQAVQHHERIGCVFYRPTSLDLGNGLEITVDEPCVLACEAEPHGYSVSVATPGRATVVEIIFSQEGHQYPLTVETHAGNGRLGESGFYSIYTNNIDHGELRREHDLCNG